MRRITLLLLGAFSLGFAPAPFLAPKPGSAVGGLRALQGEWAMTACISGGKPVPISGSRGAVFTADRCVISVDGAVVSKWRVSLDDTKSPGVMTLENEAPPAKAPGRAARCGYRLEADTLSLIWGPMPDTPPRITAGPGVTVQVYKRKKP